MTAREASIFACFTDAVVAPAPPLPAVRETDAVAAFERYLRASPAASRGALRALLLVVEVGPRALGFGATMRRLPGPRRDEYLARLERGHMTGAIAKALRGLAHVSYYGDDRVMRMLGYDADAVVARGRRLRASEGRW